MMVDLWYCPACEQPTGKHPLRDAAWIERHLALEREAAPTLAAEGEREYRRLRALAEAEIDPDALLPDPDVVEREGVGSPGEVEREGWT